MVCQGTNTLAYYSTLGRKKKVFVMFPPADEQQASSDEELSQSLSTSIELVKVQLITNKGMNNPFHSRAIS